MKRAEAMPRLSVIEVAGPLAFAVEEITTQSIRCPGTGWLTIVSCTTRFSLRPSRTLWLVGFCGEST